MSKARIASRWAWSLSSSVMPRRGPQVSNIRRAVRFISLKVRAGSTYSMPRVAKKSTSLVKAAFITSGTPATIGQLVLSITPSPKLGTWVRMGKKM